MAYCVKCGARVADDCKFCDQCGAEMPEVEENQDCSYGQGGFYNQNNTYNQKGTYDQRSCFDPQEVKKNKLMGVLSYLDILVLIPLFAGDKNSQYVRFHSNQGIILFIMNTILDILDGEQIAAFGTAWHSIRMMSKTLNTVIDIAQFAVFILMVMGIASACDGKRKPLPLIGKIKILK